MRGIWSYRLAHSQYFTFRELYRCLYQIYHLNYSPLALYPTICKENCRTRSIMILPADG